MYLSLIHITKSYIYKRQQLFYFISTKFIEFVSKEYIHVVDIEVSSKQSEVAGKGHL